MNDSQPSPLVSDDPQVPNHLRAALGEAAKEQLELVTDGLWPDDPVDHAAMEQRIRQAVRTRDNWVANCLTAEQIVELVKLAIGLLRPGRWPLTVEEASHVLEDLTMTRDLLILRDMCGGLPTPEELAEPE